MKNTSIELIIEGEKSDSHHHQREAPSGLENFGATERPQITDLRVVDSQRKERVTAKSIGLDENG
jgi:hypothetical protein